MFDSTVHLMMMHGHGSLIPEQILLAIILALSWSSNVPAIDERYQFLDLFCGEAQATRTWSLIQILGWKFTNGNHTTTVLGMVSRLFFVTNVFSSPTAQVVAGPGPAVAIHVLRTTGSCNLVPAPLISSNLPDFCHLFCREVVWVQMCMSFLVTSAHIYI